MEKTSNGTAGYYKLLNKLTKYLEDYYLTDDSGKKYFTDEKRIFMPLVLGISKGNIISINTGADSNANLYGIYNDLFKRIYK